MDAGDLVPDGITNAMVGNRLRMPDAVSGFLLDGFPRNVAQAEELNKVLDNMGAPLSVVLDLDVDFEEVVKRLSGRRTCKNCGHVWHLEYDPPATAGICDKCGGDLYQRDDDHPGTVRHRLDVYHEQTEPLIGFYREAGQLVAIDALGHVEDVTERAIAALTPYAAR
jgi:adenylate kinase